MVKNRRYIIERILKFGNLADYFWLKSIYRQDDIKEVILRDRSDLDKKSKNFWFNIYNMV